MCWRKRRHPVDPRPGYSSNRSGSSTRRGSGFATSPFTRTRTRPHPACNTASRVAHLADDPRPARSADGSVSTLTAAWLALGSYAWVLAWWAATPMSPQPADCPQPVSCRRSTARSASSRRWRQRAAPGEGTGSYLRSQAPANARPRRRRPPYARGRYPAHSPATQCAARPRGLVWPPRLGEALADEHDPLRAAHVRLGKGPAGDDPRTATSAAPTRWPSHRVARVVDDRFEHRKPHLVSERFLDLRDPSELRAGHPAGLAGRRSGADGGCSPNAPSSRRSSPSAGAGGATRTPYLR